MTKALRIAVEGNIGVGKSTLLPKLQQALVESGAGDWEILSERVDEDPEFLRLLDDFQKDPNKQPEFQAWITYRRLQEFQALVDHPKHYLFERSFLGEIVFAHANLLRHERPDARFINFFFNSVEALRKCKYDAVVYLKAAPQTCFDRIRYRARDAENNIAFDYVQHLHACYETHLPEAARHFGVPVLTLDWESFGAVDTVVEQLTAMLESGKRKIIAV
jgi:deoxyadenosine/deoxycytidine kinase